jgi:hypothetical protein
MSFRVWCLRHRRFSRELYESFRLDEIPSCTSGNGFAPFRGISKQGNSLLRFLLVEAAQVAVRSDVRWRNGSFTWHSEGEKLPKLPWIEGWGLVCTGCGAEDGITSNWKASVRTRDSLEIAQQFLHDLGR